MRRQLAWTVVILALLGLPRAAAAQEKAPKWEFAAGYNYFRANIAPACDCFNTHGGNASVTFHANNWFGIVGEFGAARNGNVQASGRDLTVFTYQAGPRFSIRRNDRATPFFHVLFGGGRAGGSLYDVPLPGPHRHRPGCLVGGHRGRRARRAGQPAPSHPCLSGGLGPHPLP